MKVTVDLEPAELWFLTSKAESKGLSLSEWIRGTVLSQFSKQLTTRDRVFILHRNGATDAEMSVRLQLGRGMVAQYRRDLGLKPNKQQHQLTIKKEKTK